MLHEEWHILSVTMLATSMMNMPGTTLTEACLNACCVYQACPVSTDELVRESSLLYFCLSWTLGSLTLGNGTPKHMTALALAFAKSRPSETYNHLPLSQYACSAAKHIFMYLAAHSRPYMAICLRNVMHSKPLRISEYSPASCMNLRASQRHIPCLYRWQT